jgi:hypothetical protein
MLIATLPQAPNSIASFGDAVDREPGHIGDILVSSYVSARIAMFAIAAPGLRRWANVAPAAASASGAKGGAGRGASTRIVFTLFGLDISSCSAVETDEAMVGRCVASAADGRSCAEGLERRARRLL